jgi:GNAT superfamily N-acetyltransferase
MVSISRANLSDREETEKIIAEYHASEGLVPNHEKISAVVDQLLHGLFPGLLLVARDEGTIVGVALAVYLPSTELGRIMNVHDFFVRPAYRRKGIGKELAKHLVEECRLIHLDEISLEIVSGNKVATVFWRSIGLKPAERILFILKVE